jgi:hypothetical protein
MSITHFSMRGGNVIHNEHAVVLERLQEETNKDEQLLKLKECILKSD